ncbi:hypothetical protein B0H15DRAFT_862628 [Mycena belliarum]|uniref:FCP1 homology domain-containing protein n=1 Tax=Mycena belliarum TaxID=1033014 RepID=A0AAD6TTW8_9AGAR|nr:hypothetical protein B0H15DRAFT_862628 [Mycena belliae]
MDPFSAYGGHMYTNEYNYQYYQSNNAFTYPGHVDYGYSGWPVHQSYLPAPPRERTPTPPPPPAEPSPEYLADSLAPQLPAPSGQRKLLIFDLNGTLLLRSPRTYGAQRKIYLRPYAGALVAYISHPDVQAWLDCMVWSSAQAHNVREMVERAFGAAEGEGKGCILRAVWARDTLGLGREAFHQKTQTTKDLAKPWAFFAGIGAPRSTSPAYTPTADNDEDRHERVPTPSRSPPPSSALLESEDPLPISAPSPDVLPIDLSDPPHGPHTTFLVDDSPLKARLQPWNHLCVAEYTAPARKHDRAAAGLPPDNEKPPASVNGVNVDKLEAEAPAGPLADELAGLAAEAAAAGVPEGTTDLGKDRWRKRRRGAVEEVDQAEEKGGPDVKVENGASGGSGVQGVSKRAKRRERKRLRAEASLAGNGTGAETEAGDESAGSASGSSSSLPSSCPSVLLPDGIEAVGSEHAPVEETAEQIRHHDGDQSVSFPAEKQELLNEPEGSGTEPSLGKRKRDANEEATRTSSPAGASIRAGTDKDSDGEPFDATLLAVIGVLAHARGVGNVAAWVRGGGLTADADLGTDAAANAESGTDVPPADPVQWFAAPRLLHAWAARGRAALAELGLEAASGVE